MDGGMGMLVCGTVGLGWLGYGAEARGDDLGYWSWLHFSVYIIIVEGTVCDLRAGRCNRRDARTS